MIGVSSRACSSIGVKGCQTWALSSVRRSAVVMRYDAEDRSWRIEDRGSFDVTPTRCVAWVRARLQTHPCPFVVYSDERTHRRQRQLMNPVRGGIEQLHGFQCGTFEKGICFVVQSAGNAPLPEIRQRRATGMGEAPHIYARHHEQAGLPESAVVHPGNDAL